MKVFFFFISALQAFLLNPLSMLFIIEEGLESKSTGAEKKEKKKEHKQTNK